MNTESEIYKQCHEHLKETDKKRDQLIASFAVIIGLLVANIEKLHDCSNLGTASLCASTLGAIVILAVIHYRKWHVKYTICIQLINFATRLGNINQANEAVKARDTSQNWKSIINPCSSTETAIFYVVSIIAFVPLQIFLSEYRFYIIELNTTLDFLPMTLNLVVFLVIVNFIALAILTKAEKRQLSDAWIFEGLFTGEMSKQSHKYASRTHVPFLELTSIGIAARVRKKHLQARRKFPPITSCKYQACGGNIYRHSRKGS